MSERLAGFWRQLAGDNIAGVNAKASFSRR
jgi:hypothetical protein